MRNFANLGSGHDQGRAGVAINGSGDASGNADGALQAGLFYVACDLRELAKVAPPIKAGEVMALCRLVEALAITNSP